MNDSYDCLADIEIKYSSTSTGGDLWPTILNCLMLVKIKAYVFDLSTNNTDKQIHT